MLLRSYREVNSQYDLLHLKPMQSIGAYGGFGTGIEYTKTPQLRGVFVYPK